MQSSQAINLVIDFFFVSHFFSFVKLQNKQKKISEIAREVD